MRDKGIAITRNYLSGHFAGSWVPGAYTSTHRMINKQDNVILSFELLHMCSLLYNKYKADENLKRKENVQ